MSLGAPRGAMPRIGWCDVRRRPRTAPVAYLSPAELRRSGIGAVAPGDGHERTPRPTPPSRPPRATSAGEAGRCVTSRSKPACQRGAARDAPRDPSDRVGASRYATASVLGRRSRAAARSGMLSPGAAESNPAMPHRAGPVRRVVACVTDGTCSRRDAWLSAQTPRTRYICARARRRDILARRHIVSQLTGTPTWPATIP